MGSKKPDDKAATVSFSSDSDEDDSSSTSSRLSSSASSGEESEVETVTFSVPRAPSGQASTQGATAVGATGESAGKVESKIRAEIRKTEPPVKTVSPEPRKSPVAETMDRTPSRRTIVSEEEPNLSKNKLKTFDSFMESGKSQEKQEEPAVDTLKVTKRGQSSTSTERPRSPKITINDVEEEPARQMKKIPEDDVTVTSTKSTNKIRASSPKKTSGDADVAPASLSSKSTKMGGREVSPRKEEDAFEDLGEVGKTTTKIGSKLTAGTANSPKAAGEEPAAVPEVQSTDRAKSPRKTAGNKDADRAKSPRETLEENDSADRAVSPKKTLQAKDAERSKSPKKTSEERNLESPKPAAKTSEEKSVERVKSPKKTAEEENVERLTSPGINYSKDAGGEAKKKSSKDSTKTPYELLRSVESPEKSPTRTLKSKKSPKTDNDDSNRKSPLSDLDGKNLEKVEIPATAEPVKPKKASKKAGKSSLSDNGADDVQTQKTGVSETKVTDTNDTASEVELLLKEIRQKRISQTSGQPELASETPESGSRSIRVTLDEAGKTDETSKTQNLEQKDGEVKDKDYMKVTRTSGSEAAAGSKPDLENEESEFTYRRKSMDDFIKRILAEAKEERLKQKHGGAEAGSTSTETTTAEERKAAGIERYAERNGDITENGLDRSKWTSNGGSSSSSGDREGSMLDRRLAKIEKRRFGGPSDAGKGDGEGGVEGSAVGKGATEEDGTTSRPMKSTKDKADYDVNLDEDLEEINRFLQARKTAAARFDFDEPGLNDNTTTTPSTTTTKRRWAADKDPQQQQPEEDEDLASMSQMKKKYNVDADFDDDDDERFLGRFKRDSTAAVPLLPEETFSPRRRDETNEVVRERTRNVRVLVDQQVEIVQAMRTTSKSLDELEKEIREVRQVCLNRQARIEALEGALGAEYRAFENDQLAASDRHQQRSTDSLISKEDFGLAGFARLRQQDKFKSESLNEENFPFRRRSGSVASTTSYTSGFDSIGGRGRPGDGSNDGGGGFDSRPPSGLKQTRDLRRTSESESDFSSGLDRRRGGSAARDRGSDASGFGPDDPITSALLGQRSARSRASIATSTPAVDYAGTISGDSFLAKIRAKYSFLAPSLDTQGYSSSSIRGQGSNLSSSYASPSLTSDSRYGRRLGSRDILSSTSSSSVYSSLGGGYGFLGGSTGGRYSSTRDTRSPGYGTGGFITSSAVSGISSTSYGDSGRMRRAQSVSEVSFDRPTSLGGFYSTGGGGVSSGGGGGGGGGEFHSRFLDKVRGKKAMGDDANTTTTTSPATAPSTSSTTPTKQGPEKPFKSRFLKTTSFDAGASRSDRLTNGFEEGSGPAGEHTRGAPPEVNGNA